MTANKLPQEQVAELRRIKEAGISSTGTIAFSLIRSINLPEIAAQAK